MNERESKQLLKYLKEHTEDYLFKALQTGKSETSSLYASLKKDVAENCEHIKIINDEMGQLRDEQRKTNETIDSVRSANATEHAEIKTDLKWVKKFQWIIVSTSVAALIAGLINDLN